MIANLTTNIPYKELLVKLFFEDDYSKIDIPRPEWKKNLSEVIDESFVFNALGDKEKVYKLNSYGRTIARLILMEQGWEPDGSSGIAMEFRHWECFTPHKMKAENLVNAFRKICEMGDVPFKSINDWREDRIRVICKNIDRAIARISMDIQWEVNKEKGPEYLKEYNWDEEMIWLWIHFFDKFRTQIRKGVQQEFIIWDS